jgi:hypothetical protein
MQLPWRTQPLNAQTEGGARTLTTARAHVGTQLAASLSWRSTAEIGTKETYAMLFIIEMHATTLKTGAKSETALSANDMRKGSVITMALTTTSPTNSVPQPEDTMMGGGGVKAFSRDMKRVCWPLNFNPSRIEKYDGSTNPTKWLEVYQLTIKSTGGDSYVIANYSPVCPSSSARTCLLGLLTGSVRSWSHLCWQFISNFWATYARPGVEWDLASMVQKKGESL